MTFSAAMVKGGGGGDGRSIRNTITQYGHAFQPGMVVRRDPVSGDYVAASSGTFDTSNTVGIIESVTTNTFVVVYQGELDFGNTTPAIDDLSPSLTNGYVYYLSSSPSLTGALSPTKPTDPAVTYHPLFVATGSKKGIVINALPRMVVGSTLYSPVGSIVPYGGKANDVPANWLLCAGDAVSKTSYDTLYTRIGDSYRIVGLEDTIAAIGASANASLTVKFTGVLEDAPSFGPGSNNIHSIATNGIFKLSWNSGKDVVVAVVTAVDDTAKTVTFKYLNDHPTENTTSHTTGFFGSLVGSVVTPITIQSLRHGEVTGLTSTAFFLPDLRARSVFGVGADTGLTNTNFGRGQYGGAQTHILTQDEMPSHKHDVKVTSTSTSVGDYYIAPAAGQPTQASAWYTNFATTEATGHDDAFGIVPPYMTANWIIRYKNATGVLIDECLPGPIGPQGSTGSTGCSVYLKENIKSGLCWSLVFGFTGDNSCTGATFGITGCDGLPGQDGADGKDGTDGKDGKDGKDCVCTSNFASPRETSVYISPNSIYNGAISPESFILPNIELSTSKYTPTDFNYFKSSLMSSNTPFADEFAGMQHFNYLNPRDPAVFSEVPSKYYSYFIQPSEFRTRDLTNTINLNVDEGNNAAYGQMNFVFQPGTYSIKEPFAMYGNRKVTIGGDEGSVFTVPMKYIKVIACYGATGTTQDYCFRLNCVSSLTGLNEPLVSTGNYTLLDTKDLSFVSGLNIPLGFTGSVRVGGFTGGTGATCGFASTLVGIYPVVSNGWSGNSSFTLEIPHVPVSATAGVPVGIPYNQVLNTTTGLSAMTIYTTVFEVNDVNGFLLGDRGTHLYVGTGSKTVNLEPIVIVYKAGGETDGNYPNKITSNAVGIQTAGRVVVGNRTGVVGFPTGLHVVSGGRGLVDGGVFVGNYNGVAADNASVKIQGGIINRNQFGASVSTGSLEVIGKNGLPTMFGRNGLAVAVQSAELRMKDVTTTTAAVVRESPAAVAINSSAVILDNIVADHPVTWMGANISGVSSLTGSGSSTATNTNSYSFYAVNSKFSFTDPTLSVANSKTTQVPVIALDSTDMVLRSQSSLDSTTVLTKQLKVVTNGDVSFNKPTITKYDFSKNPILPVENLPEG